MRDSWLGLVDSLLRPARPRLETCAAERERCLDERRAAAGARARAKARCEARIEGLRAEVFAAKDGVVSARMTDLEREWRILSRPDADAGLMDLWARIAPASWIDRKRWRDSEPEARVDAAIALAAGVEGVEAAERAVASLRVALSAWDIEIGPRIRWRAFAGDGELVVPLLSAPLTAAREALASRGVESVVLERAQHLEREIHEAARARFPEREGLARDLAHAAFVDAVWHAAFLAAPPNPVSSLRDLWKSGYVLSALDASGMILELPPL